MPTVTTSVAGPVTRDDDGPTVTVPRGRLLGTLPPAPSATAAQRIAYARYLAMWRVVESLPAPAARRLPRLIGRAWFRAASSHQREQVARNLGRVLRRSGHDVHARLLEEAFVSYARYWVDAFRVHRMDVAAVIQDATSVGLHHIDTVRDAGTGGILATAHLGSWDVGALWSSHRRWGMVVVAEVVEPRRLFERFVDLRVDAGLDVIPLVRGGPMLEQLEMSIGSGGLATLLADRDLTRRGPIVEFFGEPCRLPPGAAALARRTGRSVATGAWLTSGDAYHGVVLDPVDVSGLDIHAGTQVIAHRLEELIGLEPTQWHVFVPNWLSEREPDHPVVDLWRSGRDWRSAARQEWHDRAEPHP
jgi:phosphatidylinositol dimannoside acyltransferase